MSSSLFLSSQSPLQIPPPQATHKGWHLTPIYYSPSLEIFCISRTFNHYLYACKSQIYVFWLRLCLKLCSKTLDFIQPFRLSCILQVRKCSAGRLVLIPVASAESLGLKEPLHDGFFTPISPSGMGHCQLLLSLGWEPSWACQSTMVPP